MKIITDLTSVLLGLISAGAGLRIIISAVQLMSGEEDEKPQIKKRIRNTAVFLIIALSATGLKEVIMSYYS